jgi:hypothetical protein
MNFSEFAQQNGIEVIQFNPNNQSQQLIGPKTVSALEVIFIVVICIMVAVYIKLYFDDLAENERKPSI